MNTSCFYPSLFASNFLITSQPYKNNTSGRTAWGAFTCFENIYALHFIITIQHHRKNQEIWGILIFEKASYVTPVITQWLLQSIWLAALTMHGQPGHAIHEVFLFFPQYLKLFGKFPPTHNSTLEFTSTRRKRRTRTLATVPYALCNSSVLNMVWSVSMWWIPMGIQESQKIIMKRIQGTQQTDTGITSTHNKENKTGFCRTMLSGDHPLWCVLTHCRTGCWSSWAITKT